MSTLVPKFQVSTTSGAVTGSVNRSIGTVVVNSSSKTVTPKLSDFISVKDFGAIGDGTTNDAAAINAALSYMNSIGGGTLYFPDANYVVSSPITHYSNTRVVLGLSYLNFNALNNTTAVAWTILGGSGLISAYEQAELISGGLFRCAANGVVGTSGTTCFQINVAGITFSNVSVDGFGYAVSFLNNSYQVIFQNCAFNNNIFALYADGLSQSNMGASYYLNTCTFASNNYVVFNRLCDFVFSFCEIVQNNLGCVQNNFDTSGGVINGFMFFNTCRFENLGSAGYSAFLNNGYIVFRDCGFYVPLGCDYMFGGSGGGVVQITGGFIEFPTGNSSTYLASNNAVTTSGVISNQPYISCVYMSPNNSGIYNNGFELGTTAGWAVNSGTSGNFTVTTTTPHTGTYCGQLAGVVQIASYASIVPSQFQNNLLNFYYKNASSTGVGVVVQYYTATGTLINQVSGLTGANVSTYTLFNINSTVPTGASYFYVILNYTAGTQAFLFDDVYVNFS